MELRNILCPLDFSEFSARAYAYAQSLARHYQTTLFAVHVIQSVFSAYPTYINPDVVDEVSRGLRSFAAEELKEFLEKHTQPGMRMESQIQEGDITDTILALAQAREAELIVMGTHGRRGLDHWLLGSITEKVLRKARCPVLAVHSSLDQSGAPPSPEVQIRRILFCVDFSAHSDTGLRYALSLAQEYNAELTMLHVIEDSVGAKDPEKVRAEATEKLRGLFGSSGPMGGMVKTHVSIGKPYAEIVRYARETAADLIILGVRGRNVLDLALFGSTTHRVIQQSSCPVLAVHI